MAAARKTVGANYAYAVTLHLPDTEEENEEHHEFYFTTFHLAQVFMIRELDEIRARCGSNIREADEQFPQEVKDMTWEELRSHLDQLTEDAFFRLKIRNDGMGYNKCVMKYVKIATRDDLPVL